MLSGVVVIGLSTIDMIRFSSVIGIRLSGVVEIRFSDIVLSGVIPAPHLTSSQASTWVKPPK